jgi:hypothetical protein
VQALKKSINGIINKVNALNIKSILAEVFREVRRQVLMLITDALGLGGYSPAGGFVCLVPHDAQHLAHAEPHPWAGPLLPFHHEVTACITSFLTCVCR